MYKRLFMVVSFLPGICLSGLPTVSTISVGGMKLFSGKIWFVCLLFTLFSCHHKSSKEEGAGIEAMIRLSTLPKFTHSSFLARTNTAYMFFVVEIYEDDFSGKLVVRREIGVNKSSDGSASAELKELLPEGHYKVVAWAVSVGDVNGTDCLFYLTDLAKIEYREPYVGCSDKKECYEAQFDMDLSADGESLPVEFSKEMTCPMASVEIIASDLEEFYRQVGGDAATLGEYRVRWNYGLYFPVGYNALTRLPNKAEKQISFETGIGARSGTEASMGFDYIFVNGQASQVSVTLALYDKSGKLLNVYSDITVKLERGKTTVIRGEYLTNRKDSGATIDPDFDGEIDVVLP